MNCVARGGRADGRTDRARAETAAGVLPERAGRRLPGGEGGEPESERAGGRAREGRKK